MNIDKKQTSPEETVLTLAGQLNFTVRKQLKIALQDTQTEGTKYVLLDLTKASCIDCAVLGIIVQTKQELAEAHITLSIVATPGRVFNALHAMNLDKMMPITTATQEV